MKKLFIILAIALISGSCMSQNNKDQAYRKERNLKNFDKIELSGAIDLNLVQGGEEKVAVAGSSDEATAKIRTEVKGNVLKIYYNDNSFWHSGNSGKTNAYVTFKTLKGLEISGASSVKTGNISTKNLKIELSGASSFDGNITVENAYLDLSGASSMHITGSASVAKIDASGASNLKGYDLKTNFCKLEASGASQVKIFVLKELSAEATGGSSVYYKGDCTVRESDASGGASIKRKADRD